MPVADKASEVIVRLSTILPLLGYEVVDIALSVYSEGPFEQVDRYVWNVEIKSEGRIRVTQGHMPISVFDDMSYGRVTRFILDRIGLI